ncbi:DsbA family protein [Microbacterium sp. 11MF]|uniref:DsbA family protein n=1 Tax=Microbacterium sp. 11MF TaxID=1169146 RepID=UPI00037CC844|nr:thioredoxin domain-containing protein [Microbacterium sp. 11MF]
MSTDSGDTPSSATDRREAVREKAKRVHVRQSRARLARRISLGVLATGAVAAVAAVVVWSVTSTMGGRDLTPETASSDGFAVSDVTGVASDQGAIDDSAVEATPGSDKAATPAPTASATAPVDIRVYVDYLSPGAREWQLANVDQLTTWVDEGAATLSYHPVSMLTAKSNGTKYSLRAAAAAACVATHDESVFFAYNTELLTRQPAMDTDGFSDVELADLAQAVGAGDPDTLRSCIEDGDYVQWAKDATERAIAGIPDTDGLQLTGTPMILVNGQPYMGALKDAAEFSQFVLTSASDAFYTDQTPTPTPTAPATPAAPATPEG